ncbi:hypothetical protein R4B61_00450 [Fructilactobacillus vespulae]|uniref:hypothetical protein n=1 Tax=Fructilactobacillus vespulae TaxID=1249630 RepID=UPI0039B6092A
MKIKTKKEAIQLIHELEDEYSLGQHKKSVENIPESDERWKQAIYILRREKREPRVYLTSTIYRAYDNDDNLLFTAASFKVFAKRVQRYFKNIDGTQEYKIRNGIKENKCNMSWGHIEIEKQK